MLRQVIRLSRFEKLGVSDGSKQKHVSPIFRFRSMKTYLARNMAGFHRASVPLERDVSRQRPQQTDGANGPHHHDQEFDKERLVGKPLFHWILREMFMPIYGRCHSHSR